MAERRVRGDSVELRTLEEVCQCSVCLERYSDPKLLPCGHCFCKGCLEDMFVFPFEKGRVFVDEVPKITCPNCRADHRLENGLSNLPGNVQLVHLLDVLNASAPRTDGGCDDFEACIVCDEQTSAEQEVYKMRKATHKCFTCDKMYCIKCIEKQHSEKQTFEAKEHFIAVRKKEPHEDMRYYCIKHNSILKYFCIPCNKVCCIDCILQEHKRHAMDSVCHAFENVQHSIRQASEQIQATVEATQIAREECFASINDVKETGKKIAAGIRSKKNLIMGQVCRVLDQAEDELLRQFNDASQVFMLKVSKDIQRLGNFQGTARTAEKYLQDINNISDQTDLLIMGNNLSQQLQEQSKLPELELFRSDCLSFFRYVGQDVSRSVQLKVCLDLLDTMGILQSPSSYALAQVFAPPFLRMFNQNSKEVQDIFQEMINAMPSVEDLRNFEPPTTSPSEEIPMDICTQDVNVGNKVTRKVDGSVRKRPIQETDQKGNL